ncbi:MAG: M48 family metalloprotease [Deltaproteobacteria bacterium]|nr:M48 family metalloprotease [Deltaproteobacteria bacterium]
MTVSLAIYTFSSSARRVFKIYRGGASFLPTSLGGVPLSPTSTVLMTPEGRARETILQNVLSEMCLAAGISEPDLYVLPNEASINAMAVGLSPEESSIVITKGALQYLDRDELSGLIGHELSHIINGDARHNTIMTGWLHGYFSLTSVGLFMLTRMWRVLWLIPLGFTLIILGFLGDLAGKLIQAGFNRGRESMADAYSVQFTRDPSCLAGVLKKIGGLDSGSYISYININALECRHLFIAESLKSLFQAHPPLSERVWALEPNWDGYWHDFEADPVDFLKTP